MGQPARRASGAYARYLRAVVIGAVLLLMLGIMALGLRGGGASAPAAPGAVGTPNPGDAQLTARGREVYAATCAVCHGATLAGHPAWTVGAGEGLAPPLDASGPSPGKSTVQLVAITRDGTAAGMPGYGGTLSDEDLRAVVSYIVSTWPPEARAAQPAE